MILPSDCHQTLTQQRKTRTAAMLLNWTCRRASGTKLGWPSWFSSRCLRRLLTMEVLVMFMMMAATLSWRRHERNGPVRLSHTGFRVIPFDILQ